MSPGDRKRILIRWADLIEANGREIGLIETIDAGKPITDTVGLDVPETATCIRWHAEAADKLYGQVAPSPEGTVATITREPCRRRRRRDPVELPGADGRVEARAGARDRQHRRDQAGVDDVAVAAPDRGAGLRGGHPGRRAQRRHRPGRHRRRGDRPPSRHRLRRVHGLDRGRPPVPDLRGRDEPQARPARARRQVAPSSCSPDAADMADVAANVAVAIFWNMGENCSAGSRLLVHRSRQGPS